MPNKFLAPLHTYLPQHWIRTFLLTSWLLALPSITIAGLFDEHSWTAESSDGKYILVQLQLDPESVESEDLEGVELKKKYSTSGLYLNDETNNLLWELPYHPPCFKVYFSINGDNIVLACELPDHSISNIGLGAIIYFYHKTGTVDFWDDTQLSYGWSIKELLNSLIGQQRQDWTNVSFNAKESTYTVKTNHAEEFVFDIRTGKIIRTRSLWNLVAFAYLVAMPILIMFSFKIRTTSLQARKTTHSSTWQFSIRELFLVVTFASILSFLSTYSKSIAITLAINAFLGGGMAWLISSNRNAC